MRKYCLGTGFFEIINFSFFSTKDIELFLIPENDDAAAMCRS